MFNVALSSYVLDHSDKEQKLTIVPGLPAFGWPRSTITVRTPEDPLHYHPDRRGSASAFHLFGKIVVFVANVALVAITLRRMTLLSLQSDTRRARNLPGSDREGS